MHPYAAPRERQRDPARADAELERVPVAAKIRQEGDDGVDDGRVGQVGVPLVVALGHGLTEVAVVVHRPNLAQSLGAAIDAHRVGQRPGMFPERSR